jgi:hypothetical protein
LFTRIIVMAFHSSAQELPFSAVRVTSSFWKNRVRAARDGALPAMYKQMKDTGRWDCLRLEWKEGDPKKPYV